MPTKITVIYDNPIDPAVFEAGYIGQPELARAVPGLVRLETSRIWPKEDGTATPAYRLLDLYFDGYDEASYAVTTPEAGALFAAITSLATGGVRVVFARIEDQ